MEPSIAENQAWLEKLFQMGGGSVLGLTKPHFIALMEKKGINIENERYGRESSAKRLRAHWRRDKADQHSKTLEALLNAACNANLLDPTMPEVKKAYELATHLSGKNAPGAARWLADFAKDGHFPHLQAHLRRIEDSVEQDPEAAIGAAKELLETICKTILVASGDVEPKGTFGELLASTRKCLGQLPTSPKVANFIAKNTGDRIKAVQQTLKGLAQTAEGLSDLRNRHGTGHGREGRSISVMKPRHARLAVGAACSLAAYFAETARELGVFRNEENKSETCDFTKEASEGALVSSN